MFRLSLLGLLLLACFCYTVAEPIFPTIYIVDLEFWGEKCDSSEELCGIYPDIFKELSKRMELPLKLVIAPYPRVINGISIGSADFTISLPKEFEDTTMVVGDELWKIQLGVLSLKSMPVTDMKQLSKMSVGTIRNAAFSEDFQRDTTIKKVPSVQHRNLLKMLRIGRIDAIASDLSIMKGIVETQPDLKQDFAEPLLVTELSLHLIMSRKSPFMERFKEINDTLKNMRDDGTIRDIVLRYLK